MNALIFEHAEAVISNLSIPPYFPIDNFNQLMDFVNPVQGFDFLYAS